MCSGCMAHVFWVGNGQFLGQSFVGFKPVVGVLLVAMEGH